MLPLTAPTPDAAAIPGGFGLYVHWPFCASKCPYCDFNSHVREGVDQARWRAAMLRELDTMADRLARDGGPRRRLDSVFFGGGTPSLMPPETVAALLARADQHWGISSGVEVTLEANPTSSEAARFAGFRAAGVNRLSMGIQALNDTDLKVLGRKHSAAEAQEAIALAKRSFDRFSFDLIYARPGQTVAVWQDELSRALDLAVGHLSLYQLTIEEGTQFHTLHQRGALVVPDEEVAGDLYEATQALLNQAGMPAYEVSNHARPGQESRHNLVYWRYGDYVGVGPGAHGRLTLDGQKIATRTHRAPEVWLQRVEEGGTGAHADEGVTPELRAREALMMGLRLAEGVSLSRLAAEGAGLSPVNPAAVERLTRHGFLTRDNDRLVATPEGRQRLNGVLAALLG
ncbi:radical SAM family heme chaperone HemW [Nitrospirillum iridis]|uniref:Heme chaperone HemW n=1 Tax=Nitrospirillum iridis TaxID=765888 RepID=A0A7X0EGH0_9PROT|nr:radical SAM family heme chaperone HemW [Nitrospirillum iridis]MBB6253574.1 oxygen-independent coproporphyrinogen-3 oxidase [Nitrospirillum iridis]